MPKTKRRILLVDDNPVAQKMTARAFANDGYEVRLAFNQEECLRLALSEKPDVILMDIIFPDGDGRHFVQKLKQEAATRDIPVVFATNTIDLEDDKGDLTITVDGGTYRAFAKPLHYPKLLSTVRKEINRARNNQK